MPDGRAARIALEAAFLVAVAAVLGVAEVRPLWIVLVMLLAWVIVALLEWVAWREEPHWASGSPPRYYVPEESLPPRPPSRELPAFGAYPRMRPEPVAPVTVNKAPTWIATPEMREELLGWAAAEPEPEPEPAVAPEPEPLPEPVAAERQELPVELLTVAAAAPEQEQERDDEEDAGWPVDDGDTASDPWTAAELDGDEEQPEPETEPAPVAERRVRHRIDPFDGPGSRRWPWQRRAEPQVAVAELPPLPRHVRLDAGDGSER